MVAGVEDDDAVAYEYAEAVNDSLECPICRTPFVAPTLTPCQHVFCHRCIHLALDRSPTCPIDRQALAASELASAPRIIHRLVDELKVICPCCSMTFERALLENHLVGCERKRDKGKGKEKNTSMPSTTPCGLCHEELDEVAQSLHAASCPAVPLACPHCAASLVRSALPTHLLTCGSVPVPCPHSVHGCPTRVSRSNMPEHLELTCPFEPLKTFFASYSDRVLTLEEENRVLHSRVGSLEEGMKDLRSLFEGIRSTLGDLYTPPSPPLSATPSSPPQSPAPLPTILTTLTTSIHSLSSSLSTLDARQSTEARLISEDVQSLRGGVHHVRMQLHYVLSELGRRGGPPMHHPVNSSGSADGGESNSDDEQAAPGRRFFGPVMPHPSMMMPLPPPVQGHMGMGMPRSPPFLGGMGMAPYGGGAGGGGMKL